MVKNICQNPSCWTKRTKDQWNKKISRFQSRKAYYNDEHDYRIFSYFCTTSCANKWLDENIENIIERKHCPNKITEKIIAN